MTRCNTPVNLLTGRMTYLADDEPTSATIVEKKEVYNGCEVLLLGRNVGDGEEEEQTRAIETLLYSHVHVLVAVLFDDSFIWRCLEHELQCILVEGGDYHRLEGELSQVNRPVEATVNPYGHTVIVNDLEVPFLPFSRQAMKK